MIDAIFLKSKAAAERHARSARRRVNHAARKGRDFSITSVKSVRGIFSIRNAFEKFA
jgi:hypothetical protein